MPKYCQRIDPNAGRWRQKLMNNQAAGLKFFKSLGQYIGADARQSAADEGKSFRAKQKFANDEKCPPITEKVERMGGNAALVVLFARTAARFCHL